MKIILTLILMSSLSLSIKAAEAPVVLSTDTIINLPIADTWILFTTVKGLQDAGYQQVTMSLKLGEHFHAERNTEKNTEVVDAIIISFDPKHMVSWRWSNNSSCWSVLYFNAMGGDMTQIRWIDMCDSNESGDLNAAAVMHRNLFDQLVRRYAPECHVCKEEREATKQSVSTRHH